MATLTSTDIARHLVFGDKKVNVVQVAYSGTYATGGDSLTAASLGMNKIKWADVELTHPITGVAAVRYDTATEKLVAVAAAGTEVANATAVASLQVKVTAHGY